MIKNILTISISNNGHGTFPRQVRMVTALCNRGYKVYWICPEKIRSNKNIQHIQLMFNFIPNFLFIGLFIKIFFTSLFNIEIFLKITKVFVIREYDGLALFFNPLLNKSKKIFFSRGDVISILKINLPDQNTFKKISDYIIIYFYPLFRKLLNYKTDFFIFQQNFLKRLYFNEETNLSKKIFILNNNCPEKKNYKKKTLKKKKKFRIGFSAPMYWSCKGLDNIANIINYQNKTQNIQYEFRIAGDGPHLSILKKKLDNNFKNKITFLGWQKNIYIFLRSIDLLIIPSNFDSNPNMILEALSCDKIILATNIDAHKSILNSTEVLFKKNQIKLLYNKIGKINKNQIYKKKIKKIMKLAKEKNSFNWNNHFYKIIERC
jgi:hypothetical protein